MEYIRRVFSVGVEEFVDLVDRFIEKVAKDERLYLMDELPIAVVARMINDVEEIDDMATALKVAFNLGVALGAIDADCESKSISREFAANIFTKYLIEVRKRFGGRVSGSD